MKKLKITFWLLVANFLLVLGNIFIPGLQEIFQGTILFLLPAITLFFLGIMLLIWTRKEKVSRKLKKYLLLTGGGAAGLFIGVFLHNFFFALSVLSAQIIYLKSFFDILHVAFFLMATIVCPVALLVGIVGSIVLFFKE